MRVEDIEFLLSADGKRLCEEYADAAKSELSALPLKLHRKVPYIGALVTMLLLRIQASRAGKFTHANTMCFTQKGYEQSTSEEVARYVSGSLTERLGEMKAEGDGRVVYDLGCSIGGNALCFADSYRVTGVDMDEVHVVCARENARVYDVSDFCEFIVGDVWDFVDADSDVGNNCARPWSACTSDDVVFLDPARDRDGKSKTRSFVNASPNIVELLPRIFEKTRNVVVKVSPTFDYKELELLPEVPEVEMVSEEGSCKAAFLWFGDLKRCDRSATLIDEFVQRWESSGESAGDLVVPAGIADFPGAYMFELDGALIRAQMVEQIACEYELQQLNAQTAFLTGDLPACLNGLVDGNEADVVGMAFPGSVFATEVWGDFSVAAIRAELVSRDIDTLTILTRRFPESADVMRGKFGIVREGGEWVLLLTVFADDRRGFVLCRRV